LVIWSFLAENLKIAPFRRASGKIPKASAGLGLEQRFFLNGILPFIYAYLIICVHIIHRYSLYFKAIIIAPPSMNNKNV